MNSHPFVTEERPLRSVAERLSGRWQAVMAQHDFEGAGEVVDEGAAGALLREGQEEGQQEQGQEQQLEGQGHTAHALQEAAALLGLRTQKTHNAQVDVSSNTAGKGHVKKFKKQHAYFSGFKCGLLRC